MPDQELRAIRPRGRLRAVASTMLATAAIGWLAPAALAQGSVQPPYRSAWRLPVPLAHPCPFGLSAPVVSGSTVIAVGATSVVAADLSSGHELWHVPRAFGPSTAPAIADAGKHRVVLFTEGFGTLQPGSCSTASPSVTPVASTGASGSYTSDLTAIDLATRRPAWDHPLTLKRVSRTGVTVDGDTAFVGDDRGTIYAVDAATGTLRWSVHAGAFLTTSLAAADGVVVATLQATRTTSARVVAFKESDGSRAWEQEESGVAYASSPAAGDGIVVVGFSDQSVRAFDLAKGTERWSARINAPVFFMTSTAVGSGVVAVVDIMGTVYALDAGTGVRRWEYALNESALRAPPAVDGDVVLASTARGRLVAIALGSGRLVWESAASGDTLRDVTVADGTVVAIAGGTAPGIVAFEPDPNGTLVSLVSPTIADYPRILGTFVVAAIPLAALLILGGRALRGRLGPAFLPDEDGDGAEAEA